MKKAFKEITVSVVVVTYNRLNLLKECLQAIDNQTIQFNHIIIIDNASTDGTTAYLKEYKRSNAIIIIEKENAGGAAGYWRGVSEFLNIDDDYALLIDDDAILYHDFLKEIVRIVNADQEKHAAYAGVVMSNGKIDLSHRKKLVNKNHFYSKQVEESLYSKASFECDLASFCGFLIKKEIINKIGLPLKEFFIWYDDTEYSMRIRRFTSILVATKARLNHKTKNTTAKEKTEMDWKNFYGIRNEMIIVKKYYGRKEYMWFLLRNIKRISSDLTKAVIQNEHKAHLKNAVMRKDALLAAVTGEMGENKKYKI